ncbi:hypothetical protein L2E82_46390 [Cichorium intybus]|uniref:Uncharacterized protein n=1 Tax=Cichorium intybus TaxID=13427 RepID=A0ACB8YTG1_CICIN|nr:hypothetical protein L2E82_46390 [Cichorium intybus]
MISWMSKDLAFDRKLPVLKTERSIEKIRLSVDKRDLIIRTEKIREQGKLHSSFTWILCQVLKGCKAPNSLLALSLSTSLSVEATL